MLIRYKVVSWNRESVWVGKGLSLTYQKGKITKAHPDSLGIMVFGTIEHAEAFRTILLSHIVYETQILRVRPIGEEKKTNIIINIPHGHSMCVKRMKEIFTKFNEKYPDPSQFFGTTRILRSFHGVDIYKLGSKTLCYSAVEVLE